MDDEDLPRLGTDPVSDDLRVHEVLELVDADEEPERDEREPRARSRTRGRRSPRSRRGSRRPGGGPRRTSRRRASPRAGAARRGAGRRRRGRPPSGRCSPPRSRPGRRRSSRTPRRGAGPAPRARRRRRPRVCRRGPSEEDEKAARIPIRTWSAVRPASPPACLSSVACSRSQSARPALIWSAVCHSSSAPVETPHASSWRRASSRTSAIFA